jgi:stage II sporulation protein P
MRAALIWTTAALLIISLALPAAGATPRLEDYFDLSNLTERTDGYFTMRNRADGSVLLVTARILHAGNKFIDRENNLYRVTAIEEDTAWAEYNGKAGKDDGLRRENTLPAAIRVPAQVEGNRPKIGIYHSHGAESYVPTDGTGSIDEGGGILDVGEAFSRTLEEQGVETVHSKEPHVPHDAGAYHRSRRTAEELLAAENVDLLFDVHRDAVPPETYETEVNGERVTQILLVVGEQNQNSGNNWQLAQELKAIADERHPGLVKGILAAPGSYNQDLSPQSLLIEVGAHENKKEDAERAVTLFADVVNEYMTGEAAPERAPRASRIAFSSVLIVLLALAAALFIYLLIAAGSWEEFKHKAVSFFRREFADVQRGFKRIRGDDDHR